MSINTKYRTDQPEIMDDFNLEGKVLEEALIKIAKINQFLGGNKLTLQGLKVLLEKSDTFNEITIVDIGCGNGDMLRYIANYGIKRNYNFKLIGVDANKFTIKCAENLSKDYKNITYNCIDIFNEQFKKLNYDIVLSTLTLHHFKNEEILKLMGIFNQNSTIGIVVNDLQRSKIAYQLFRLICFVFRLNKMSKEDGLVSILRGFKKQDFIDFSNKLNLKKYYLTWKWAFRYQWIIEKK